MKIENMSHDEFEEFMKNAIIQSYIKVYGEEKWIGATNEERSFILHTVAQSIGKAMDIA